MEELKNHYSTNNNHNIIYGNSQTFQNINLNNIRFYTAEEKLNEINDEPNIYGNTFNSNINNNNQNNPINIEINQKSEKNLSKKSLTPDLFDKICLYINDMKEIDKVVPFCEERKRKELLLDRGLLLSLKTNEIMDECGINIEDILYKKYDNIDFDKKLLDENYWMNQKVDKYARTEQRKRIPQERWFMIKDKSFTPNLNKCFALNRGKFIDTYNWLNSLENK